MASKFFKVRCECGHEQVLFSHAAMTVKCQKCGAVLQEPMGGKAVLVSGTLVEEYE